MKRKINLQLMGIASLAIILTVILISFIFYEVFKLQVMDDLKISAHLLKNREMEEFLSHKVDMDTENIRITIISKEGEVVYDNDVQIGTLDNHANRPEVLQALQHGEGQAIRRSNTIDADIFYYAVTMKNEMILRLGREAGNILAIMSSSLPVIAGVAVILLLICIVLANLISENLIRPIENLANQLDNIDEEIAYPELLPFVQRIREQHEDIMKGARMRQDFTANVSHELKTPLAAISGYAELIENGMADEGNVRRFAGEIHKNSKRLLTLINDIIRLSELDTVTGIQQTFEPVNIYMIAQTCVDVLQLQAENHRVTLSFEGEPCYVFSTKEMIEEVLYNLCDNAIRYNNVNGSVRVSVKCTSEKVILSIKDTGIGIPRDQQERVFERFYRVDKSRSKSTGGTGLGLAIVKHILVQTKAQMELFSEAGEGTEIVVVFPRAEES